MAEPIALDLEGVLADTHIPVVEHSNVLDESHFEGWDFQGEELDDFLATLEHVWAEHWRDIPPSSPTVPGDVADLRSIHDVHLVTNTPADPGDVKKWLDYVGVDVDDYVFNGEGYHKEDLEYNVYIDDNPYLLGEVPLLYFIETPWNDHYTVEDLGPDTRGYDLRDGDDAMTTSIEDDTTVVFVDSLGQVFADLTHRSMNDAVAI